ncbi:MAG: hypothetical protein RRC34_01735 [Lentisphaeria bacterium]|nr:hypothetical protein [Lentisphaeria bacterium]
MKQPELVKKMLNEWELAALVAALALCLAAAVLWLSSWLGDAEEARVIRGGGDPPIPPTRVNDDSAYAMLEKDTEPELVPAALFTADMRFAPPQKYVPKPTPTPAPDPAPRPKLKPKPIPVPTPVPAPLPEPEPEPEPEYFVYQGYVRTDDGEKAAVLHNETTGETLHLREGKKFLTLYVSSFTNNSITFIRPNGKAYTLTADDKLTYRPPKRAAPPD